MQAPVCVNYELLKTDLVQKRAKPFFKQLGPKVGKLMKIVAEIILNLNEETIEHLQKSGSII